MSTTTLDPTATLGLRARAEAEYAEDLRQDEANRARRAAEDLDRGRQHYAELLHRVLGWDLHPVHPDEIVTADGLRFVMKEGPRPHNPYLSLCGDCTNCGAPVAVRQVESIRDLGHALAEGYPSRKTHRGKPVLCTPCAQARYEAEEEARSAAAGPVPIRPLLLPLDEALADAFRAVIRAAAREGEGG